MTTTTTTTTTEDEKNKEDNEFEVKSGPELPFACYICRGPFVEPIQTICSHYFCQVDYVADYNYLSLSIYFLFSIFSTPQIVSFILLFISYPLLLSLPPHNFFFLIIT
jgi:hypothetical protein